MTDAFLILEENIRGEYEFTILLLLSGDIKYIPQRKTIVYDVFFDVPRWIYRLVTLRIKWITFLFC